MPYLTANGHEIVTATIHIPNRGPWWAELDFVDEARMATGTIVLNVGDVVLHGTEDPRASGVFAGLRKMRVIGGAGGWQSMLPAKAYHSDSGVPKLSVAREAAAAVGETIGFFEPSGRLQVDYVRPSGSAGETIAYVAGGLPWWVGFDGLTHVGTRAPVAAGKYTLLNYNVRDRVATLDVDSIDAVGIGAVLSDRLDPSITVREIEIVITPRSLTFRVWHDEAAESRGRLASVMTTVVESLADRGRLFGAYTYKVVSTIGDRCNLQPLDRTGQLPDLSHVSLWPGLAGAAQTLTDGAQVVVQFRDGDRSRPMVTHYGPKGSGGFVPVSIDLCGNGAGLAVARQGDLVRSGGVGLTVALWPVTGSPPAGAVAAGVPHAISFNHLPPLPPFTSPAAFPFAQPLFGAIDTGSAKVRAG